MPEIEEWDPPTHGAPNWDEPLNAVLHAIIEAVNDLIEAGGGGGGVELDSPAFTGTPTAPTVAGTADSSTKIATTAFVQAVAAAAVTSLIGTAPGVLNNLGEISDAINDDANLYTTLVSMISAKAALLSPVFTGTPSLPTGTTGVTQSTSDDSTKLATTAFVHAVLVAMGLPDFAIVTPSAMQDIIDDETAVEDRIYLVKTTG